MQSFLTKAPRHTVHLSIPSANDFALSADEKAKYLSITTAIEESKPKHELILWFKTTKKAKIAILIMEAKRDNGTDMWFFKTPLDKVWSQYFSATPNQHKFTNKFFTTMQTAKRRDNNAGTNDHMVSVNKKNGHKFPVGIFWCFVNIPVEKFTSVQEETTWIKENTQVAWNNFRKIQITPLFNAVHNASLSDAMKTAMTQNKYGPTFTQFVQECRVVVKPVDCLNKYIILDDVKDIMLFFVKNELEHKKYPNSDVANPLKTSTPSTPKKKVHPKSAIVTPTLPLPKEQCDADNNSTLDEIENNNDNTNHRETHSTNNYNNN